jgi:hypothetical protein
MTNGEKWIRLLRAYGPVADSDAQEAEHVDKLAARLGVPKLYFKHPALPDVIQCFPKDTGQFKTIVLTGTAGDGKTSLCYDLVEHLTGALPARDQNSTDVQTFDIPTFAGSRRITMIYDVTSWRERTGATLKEEHVAVMEAVASSVYGGADHRFILAVNDGQLHEVFRALPPTCSENLKALGQVLVELHAEGLTEKPALPTLRLINLSRIPSDVLMQLCIQAVLNRPEWKCLQDEKDNPLFGEHSPLPTNYALLNTPPVQEKLILLARIADATGHHLPLRSIFILLSNALLGHPDARDRILRPGSEAATILKPGCRHRAAVHLNLFGANLSKTARRRREIYRFLAMLHVGAETTNDIDELIIFGTRDDEALKAAHAALVAPDPHAQRNPALDATLLRYIRGEIIDDKETSAFLYELACERRRIFLKATPEEMKAHSLWTTTVFRHAGEYFEHILDPIRLKTRPAPHHIRRLAAGLNRIWTGLLLADSAHEVYMATGLDLTTSPVSDILLQELLLDGTPAAFTVIPDGRSPLAVLRANGQEFCFELTLPRYEFLMRVAAGAMPSSFSRECCSDFLSLKQRCLRDLHIRPNPNLLLRLDVTPTGQVQKEHIHLNE